MAEEIEGQVPETPAEPVAQEFDLAAHNQQLASLGEDYSTETIVGKVGDLRTGMNKAQTDLAELKQSTSAMSKLQEEMNNDPALAQHLSASYTDYRGGGGVADPVNLTPPMNQPDAFNPVVQKMNQLETQIASQQMHSDLDRLGASLGESLSDEMRTQIFNKVVETGNADVAAHYWAIEGPKAKAEGIKTGKDAAIAEITKNNSAYPNSQAKGGAAPEIKPGWSNEQEWSDQLNADIAKLQGGGEI